MLDGPVTGTLNLPPGPSRRMLKGGAANATAYCVSARKGLKTPPLSPLNETMASGAHQPGIWPRRATPPSLKKSKLTGEGVAASRGAVDHAEPHRGRGRFLGTKRPKLSTSALIVTLAATTYNAVLAFVNAHGPAVGKSLVIGTELMILAWTAFFVVRAGRQRSDSLAFLMLALFVIDALFVSLLSGEVFIDMARNGAIMALFMLLGARIDEASLKRCFLVAAALVAAVLLLEIISVETYAKQLAPALYYERTRGFAHFEFDELGLFPNALGFEGRFSISNIVGHRTSSLFLEQVSLANFSSILVAYLAGMGNRIERSHRIFLVVLVIMILVTNNTRTGIAIALAGPVLYLFGPKLMNYLTLTIAPLILAIGTAVVAFLPRSTGDDFVGRTDLTMLALKDVNFMAIIGARAPMATSFADSGYTYILYSTSFVGAMLLWLLISLVLNGPKGGVEQQRCGMIVALYIFINLLISGTGAFSIKTAALLWLLIGFLRNASQESAVLLDRPSAGGSEPTVVSAQVATPMRSIRVQ